MIPRCKNFTPFSSLYFPGIKEVSHLLRRCDLELFSSGTSRLGTKEGEFLINSSLYTF